MFRTPTFEYNYFVTPAKPGVIALKMTKQQVRKQWAKTLLPVVLLTATLWVIGTVADESQRKAALDEALEDMTTPTPES